MLKTYLRFLPRIVSFMVLLMDYPFWHHCDIRLKGWHQGKTFQNDLMRPGCIDQGSLQEIFVPTLHRGPLSDQSHEEACRGHLGTMGY